LESEDDAIECIYRRVGRSGAAARGIVQPTYADARAGPAPGGPVDTMLFIGNGAPIVPFGGRIDCCAAKAACSAKW
jgi:hypothetical protein